jgi:hypothetical protein
MSKKKPGIFLLCKIHQERRERKVTIIINYPLQCAQYLPKTEEVKLIFF